MTDVALAFLTTTPVTAPAAAAAPASAADGVSQLFATMMAAAAKPAAAPIAAPDAAAPVIAPPTIAAVPAAAAISADLPVASNDATPALPIATALKADLPATPRPIAPKIASRDEDDAPTPQHSDADTESEDASDTPAAATPPSPISMVAPTLAALMALPVAPDAAQQIPVATNDAAPVVAQAAVAATAQTPAEPAVAQTPPPAVAQAIAALLAGKADVQPAPVAVPATNDDSAPADAASADAAPAAKATDAAPQAPRPAAIQRRDPQPRDTPASTHDQREAAADPARPTRDTKRIAAPDVTAAPAHQPAARIDGAKAAPADAPSAADASMTRTLAVAHDGQWLDSLARDIAATATDSTLRFRLSPEHLGGMTVQIDHADNGASVHLAADKAETRQMLVDAQPRLVAEARAQGLTLRETSVGSGGTDGNAAYSQSGSAATADQGRSNGQPGRQQTSQITSPARAMKAAPVQTSERYA